ncbi:hypothetical protein V7266_29020 [Neobacillus drentensis]|uniref:hypothetical protein n=1 Tax=Neobacillus drentensis TaxID=220684 RepID=UPI002FFF847E
MMKKDITHRIAYYTKKIAEKGSIHPSKKQPRAYTYRSQRLMAYKRIMHELIAKKETP